jgi:transcription elongation factor SPT5
MSKFVNQDFGSEDEDDDFNPGPAVESDNENAEGARARNDRHGERAENDEKPLNRGRVKRLNGSEDSGNNVEDEGVEAGEGEEEGLDEEDDDEEDDDDEDEDAVPVSSPSFA